MSKRRLAEEIVRKKSNAGFVGVSCVIQLKAEDDKEPCEMECGDPDCVGWANCRVLNEDMTPTPYYAYHVYECQMEDL